MENTASRAIFITLPDSSSLTSMPVYHLMQLRAAGTGVASAFRSTRREGEDQNADDKPDCGEHQAVAEERPEVDPHDARHHHIPEWRRQIPHVIADAERENAALDADSDFGRRFHRNETLDRPLAAARRD